MAAERGSRRSPRGPWRGLADAYDRLLTGLGHAAGFIILAIALGIGADVATRLIVGQGLRALVDIVEYALLVATFAGAPWVLRLNGHVAIDLMVAALPAGPRRVMRRAGAGVGLAVCALISVFGVQAAHEAALRGSLVFKGLVFPEWWALAVVPAGMALCAVEFGRLVVAPERPAPRQEPV